MRIVYLIHQFYPEYGAGTEAFGLNLARMMQTAGHHVTVVAPDGRSETGGHDEASDHLLLRNELVEGIHIVKFRLKNDDKFDYQEFELHDFSSEIFLNRDIDLVHVLHPMRVAGLIPYLIENAIPYVMTLTDFWTICPNVNLNIDSEHLCPGPKRGDTCKAMCPELSGNHLYFRRFFYEHILNNSERIIVPSRFSFNIFRDEITASEIEIVEHGIKYGLIKPNRKTYEKGDSLNIFYGGTIVPHKGLHVLVDAFEQMRGVDVRLVCYGPVADRIYFDRLRKRFETDDRIQYLGEYAPSDLGEILSNFDLVVLPSTAYEVFSFVLHEALACRLPVVASNTGVMAQKLENGVNGFTFDTGNSAHLAQVLTHIHDNMDILNDIKRRISSMIIHRAEQEAAIYESIYTRVLLDR